jgi:hypothetical protein
MHWLTHLVMPHGEPDEVSDPQTRGRVLNWARRYDLLVWFLSGRTSAETTDPDPYERGHAREAGGAPWKMESSSRWFT